MSRHQQKHKRVVRGIRVKCSRCGSYIRTATSRQLGLSFVCAGRAERQCLARVAKQLGIR